jgi:hypothetical protein
MSPTFGTEARTGSGRVLARVGPALIIWCDWKSELYAFCGLGCVRHYETWVCDPGHLFEKAAWSDYSFGCWWCGGDLTAGVTWLTQEPATSSV